MATHTVWKSSGNWLFSNGIIRDFGSNMVVKAHSGPPVFSVVMPLKCDPVECELEDFGTIEVEEYYEPAQNSE